MDETIRVLIVEDNTALAENLFEYLGEDRHVLDFAPDGLTALHLAATNDYDVMVLDVMLPGLSGFELCRRIREDLRCATPIIFVSARDQIDDKVSGFTQGGDDYLVKPFELRELALRIDALHRRRLPVGATMHAAGVRFDPGTLKVQVDGQASLELSGTAARLFETLMRAYPRLVTYDQLLACLRGATDADMNTLRTHVYVLRKQLQQAFDANLVKTMHGRGYRLSPPGEQ